MSTRVSPGASVAVSPSKAATGLPPASLMATRRVTVCGLRLSLRTSDSTCTVARRPGMS